MESSRSDLVHLVKSPSIERQMLRVRDERVNGRELYDAIEEIGYRIGEAIAEELPFTLQTVRTPMGERADHCIPLASSTATVGVLRAGLPLQMGVWRAIPGDLGYMGAARTEGPVDTLDAKLSYEAVPPLGGKTLIVADCMLATTISLRKVLRGLMDEEMYGKPWKVVVAGLIAAEPGLTAFHREFPKVPVYLAAIDKGLNGVGYITGPGAGDIGDRLFGMKAEARRLAPR